MKKIFIAAIAALMTSCNEHILTDDLEPTDLTAPISVETTSPEWDVQSRLSLGINENADNLHVISYGPYGGTYGYECAASNSSDHYTAMPAIQLGIGNHTVKAIAFSDMTYNGLAIDMGEVVYPNAIPSYDRKQLHLTGASDKAVYIGEQQVIVETASPQNVRIPMSRATACLRLCLFGDGWNYGNNPLHLYLDQYTDIAVKDFSVGGKQRTEHVPNFTLPYDGVGNTEGYTSETQLLCPADGYTTDVILTLVNNKKAVATDTLRNVPLGRNKVTTIKGKLANAESGLGFTFSTEWEQGEVINIGK